MFSRVLAAAAGGALLTASLTVGSASATVALSGALNSHAKAALNGQVNSETQLDSWTKDGGGPRDLMVVAGRAVANGDDFVSVQDAISAHWDSADSGSVTLLDHGWVTDVTHGRETSVAPELASPSDAPAWTYAFQATGDGAFDLAFDLSGTGQTGGLGLWDVIFSEDDDLGHLSFLTRTFPQGDFSVSGGFTHALQAGHHYQVSLITEEGIFDGILNPARREAQETGGFTWSISGGGDGSGVPEPASWVLMIAGFGGVGGLLRLRRRRGELAWLSAGPTWRAR